MKNSMEHWNGCQICVMDVETTGTEFWWHEIIQIAIVALDSNFEPRKDVLPFYIHMKPECPERANTKAMKVNKLDLAEITQKGFDQEKAKDLFREWVEKLNLPYAKGGNYRKRIIPLGQNFTFDRPFIQKWLGVDMYNEFIDYRNPDTMTTAGYLNDRAAMRGDPVPFPKINLTYLANLLNIQHDRAHDALQDCVVTAKVYKALLTYGGPLG